MKEKPLYDVFLSHTPQDAGLAAIVSREFAAAGCGVFPQQSIQPGNDFRHSMIDALVNSSATVFLLTQSSIDSTAVAFEVGAALAWDKPVFVVYDGIDPSRIPPYLQQFQVVPLTRLDEVKSQIKSLAAPLSDSQQSALTEVYAQLQTPVDRLLFDPAKLRELTDAYRNREGSAVSGKRLAQELIRLRKQGKLPRITGRNGLASASS